MDNVAILEVRMEMGLTQPKMAELIGVSKREYQRYEAGDTEIPRPVVKLLEYIAKVSS